MSYQSLRDGLISRETKTLIKNKKYRFVSGLGEKNIPCLWLLNSVELSLRLPREKEKYVEDYVFINRHYGKLVL